MVNKRVKHHQKGRGSRLVDYLPLIVLVALTALSALAKQFSHSGAMDFGGWMLDFMGFFLVVFSMFKFFDLEGFADGFQMYDLLAKHVRGYAYCYPFIEASLGLCYLAQWQLPVVYVLTIVLMLWGSAGVISALWKGLDIECACMGSVLHVPLSTVALTEDLSMALMALGMLVMTLQIV